MPLRINLSGVRFPSFGMNGAEDPRTAIPRVSPPKVPMPSPSGGAVLDTEKDMPNLPVYGQGFVIQRDDKGNIDWFSTLAQTGALAAIGIGAAKGNPAIAAAGSGYLQGRATGLQQRDARMERDANRAEAKAERDTASRQRAEDQQQRKTDQAINDVESAISGNDWEVAEGAIGRLPADLQESYRSTLRSAKGRFEAEKQEKLYVSAMRGGAEEMRAAADIIQKTDPRRAEELRSRAMQKEKSHDLLKQSEDLKAKYDESVAQAQNALRVGDYKTAAQNYQAAGIDTDAKRLQLVQMDRHKEYRQMLDKALEDASYSLDGKPKQLSTEDVEAIQASVVQRIEALTGHPFDPSVPDGAYEERVDKIGGDGALSATVQKAQNDFVAAAIKDVNEGRQSLDEQLSNVDEAIGTPLVPTRATAEAIKEKIRKQAQASTKPAGVDSAAIQSVLDILKE